VSDQVKQEAQLEKKSPAKDDSKPDIPTKKEGEKDEKESINSLFLFIKFVY